MNNKTKNLLSQAKIIIEEENNKREISRKGGDYFSIFNTVTFTRHEEQLHTPFIRMLLDINGDHGVGDAFLKSFIDTIVKELQPEFQYDAASSKIDYWDKNIGPVNISYDGNYIGGHIDIFLEDKDGNAIIIENKFNRYGEPAQEQERQLERYYNYGKDNHNGKFILIYLTPRGIEASEYSTGNKDIKYYSLSYFSNNKSGPCLISWLEQCVELSLKFPLIRETIKQYTYYIKEYIMENEELLILLANDENVSTTIDILNNAYEIKKQIRKNFLEKLRKECESYNYKLEYDDKILGYETDSWIHISDETYKGVEFCIGLEKRTGEQGGCYMFFQLTNGKQIDKKNRRMYWTRDEGASEPTAEMPLGKLYLYGPNNEDWWNWDNLETLRSMANGEILKYIKEQLEKIKNENVFKELYEKSI